MGKICYVALINLLRYLMPGIEWKGIDSAFKWLGEAYKDFPPPYPFQRTWKKSFRVNTGVEFW